MKRYMKRLARQAMYVGAGCATFIAPKLAQAQVTLPDTGVDTAGHVTAVITGLGAVVLVAVGGYFAFLLIKKGSRSAGSYVKA